MVPKKIRNIFIDGAIPASLISESVQQHNDKKDIGAHSIFLGQVRADEVDGRQVTAIAYTAYEEMALDRMAAIREEIITRHNLTCMHVYHSLGTVAAGQLCLFVFTSSARRKAAMAACEETVERIKAELPIWGRELFADETFQWKENK
jgi:molybdopterin synthase catalytic subunit